LKIHVAVNIKSKKILSLNVTDDEHVHDGKVLPKLVDDIKKSKHIPVVGKLFADGAYDSNNVLDVLQTMESCYVLK
jgi:Transposase DDE domain